MLTHFGGTPLVSEGHMNRNTFSGMTPIDLRKTVFLKGIYLTQVVCKSPFPLFNL